MGGGDVGECLGPDQGGTFAFVEIRCFMPDRQHIKALLCLSQLPGLLRVKVHAIDAAIDLRDSDLDESAKKRIKRA